MLAAGRQRFAAGAGLRRAVVAGALALVTTILILGCGSDSPSQAEEQASKTATPPATTRPGDARLSAHSDRRGRLQDGGPERALHSGSKSRPATARDSTNGGKRVDYDVERIVREATARLGAGRSSTSSHSLRRELTEDLESALAGIPPDRGAAGGGEGLAAAALRRLGIEP